ncbi:putative peptidase [Corynebacterium occultum]|uniref:Putative peptidase n=2 Tax=Corynebacterium occultum TaxID=2675219 RepID=A0A6B8W4V3_9CORY|nr:putative peptidase [Corynebacterium occultum]
MNTPCSRCALCRTLAAMKLLLTSFGHPHIAEFIPGEGGRTIAYISDAARSFATHPDTQVEREMLRGHGLELKELPLADTDPTEVDRILHNVDGVYVAGGETFDLAWVLRSTGTDDILSRHVHAGLPYIGCSAGSVIAGPSIEPVSLLDDPAIAPELSDHRGLGFTDRVIIPHASGNIPLFPIETYAELVRRYGQEHPLLLLRDGEALLIEDSHTCLI